MFGLTVNGKQLFADCERRVELLYYPELLIPAWTAFPGGGNTIYAGEYEFRVNVPDAAYVYGRNVPGMDPTPIPIVNGVAKWTNPEDFTVWNTSIYFLCLLPEDYTTVYPDPDCLDVTLTPDNFKLIKTDVPLEILGYDNISVPSDMDFVYLARTFDGDKIVNTAPNPVLGNYLRMGTLTLHGTGSTAYLSNGNSASNYLYVDLTTAQLNAMKATNSVYTYFIRVMQTTNGLGAIVSFRMLDNNAYIYMIRANYQQLQLHTTTGYDCGTNFSLSTDRVYKVVINGSSLKAYNLDTTAEYSLSYSTTRRMSTRMTSFNGYAGGNDEGTLDRFYALAGIPRATTAEEDAAIKYVLLNQII